MLPARLHNSLAKGPNNVTNFKKRFEAEFGCQKELFLRQTEWLAGAVAMGRVRLDYSDLPPQEELDAIRGYSNAA